MLSEDLGSEPVVGGAGIPYYRALLFWKEVAMQRSLVIEPSKCTGCYQCALACSFAKEGRFLPSKSRIRVFQFHEEGKVVPFTCTQCAEAWCQQVCPVDAISADPLTGAKVVSENLCVGCRLCTIACPFGTVNYDQQTGKVIKCDLCDGRPACVDACPTGAISYSDAGWTGLERMRAYADRTSTGAGA